MKLDEGSGASTKTLAKGLLLLDAIAQCDGSEGAKLSELSDHLRWNQSTTYRLLQTLEGFGYAQRDPGTQRYRLGVKILELSASFLQGLELRRQASPFLNQLMLKSGLAAHLVILEEETGDVVYIDKVDSPQPVRMYTYIGIRFPANCTAAGKAILAYLSEDQVERFIAQGLRTRTAHSISSPVSLHKELARIRELGYSIDREENAQAMRCVGAPIFDHEGNVIAAVSLSGSVAQLPLEDLSEFGSMVKEGALRISQALGYRG